MKALVVEDNVLLGKSVRRGLEEGGWVVDLALDGKEALYFVESSEYDVIVLDWMLPKLSGLDFVKTVRAQAREVPIIMVTAKGDLRDRVEGLDQGADDYLVKPFDMAELIARVNALYRRSTARGATLLELAGLNIDLATMNVTINQTPLVLTGKEYDLLVALASKAGKLVKRTAITGLLYSLDMEPDSNSLDVLLARLRRKLMGSGIEIETLRGKGFTLRVA
jgi:DNA-binding response OmpR family regulator